MEARLDVLDILNILVIAALCNFPDLKSGTCHSGPDIKFVLVQ